MMNITENMIRLQKLHIINHGKWTKEAGDGGNDEHHLEHDHVTKAVH